MKCLWPELWDLAARPVAASKWSISHRDAPHSRMDSARLKRRAISDCLSRSLVRSEHCFYFFLFCQSESGGPSAKALERPAGSRKHKVITRLPFREQVPQTNSAEETEAFKVALHESPRFSGDSLEKLLLIRQSWTCVQDFGAARLDFYRLILKYLNITAIMYRSFSATFLVFPDR